MEILAAPLTIDVAILMTKITFTPTKGGFFSESTMKFFQSPNLKKKYSKKLSWA